MQKNNRTKIAAKPPMTIAFLAGEPSGDDLGGAIATALRKKLQHHAKVRRRGFSFIGIGGPKMAAAGVKSFFPYQRIARMGLLEVVPHLPELIYYALKTIVRLRRAKPDIVISIDMPDFNKRVVAHLPSLWRDGRLLPTKIHLVAPTVWAWRRRRRFAYARIFDLLLCLFPFESKYFRDTKLQTAYVGHPLVAQVEAARKTLAGKKWRRKRTTLSRPPMVLLLPGSRVREIKNHLPLLKEFIINNNLLPAHASYIFYTLPHLVPLVKSLLGEIVVEKKISIIASVEEKWPLFLYADLALSCLGTATLELALSGCPTVGFYRANQLSMWVARRLINISMAALPNILAGKKIIPELIQQDMTVEQLTHAAQQQLTLGRKGMKKHYNRALKSLRAVPDPARRAADVIARYL